MNFSYIALNNDHQKVKGVINAPEVQEAKASLHKMGLSVLTIEQTNATKETYSVDDIEQVFWFRVRNRSGQESEGTIEAKTIHHAFRRLNSEYKFEVLAICSISVPENERKIAGTKDIEALEQEVAVQFEMQPVHYEKALAEEETDSAAFHPGFQQQRSQVLEEVDSVIETAQSVVKQYRDSLPENAFDLIEQNIQTLTRMKLSNNVAYLQKLSEELFENIQSIILKCENANTLEGGISDTGDDETEEIFVPSSGENQKMDSLKKLKLVAGRLSHMMHKKRGKKNKTPPPKDQTQLPHQSTTTLFKETLFGKSKSLRKRKRRELTQRMQEKKNSWTSRINTALSKEPTSAPKPSKSLSQKTTTVLEETRVFFQYLLAIYVVFALLSYYAFIKGFDAVIPFLKSVFETPFVITCIVGVFSVSLWMSLWHHFFRRQKIPFFITGIFLGSVFSIFVLNF